MKSRRERNAARRRSFSSHASRFEILEPRQLLTATGLTNDLANVASTSLVSNPVVSSTLATLPPVETTSQIDTGTVSTGMVSDPTVYAGPIQSWPIVEPAPIWPGPIYYPLPTQQSTGPLPAPTVSLPNTQAPINGGVGTGISGIWVDDRNSDDMTVTICVQHGTLSVPSVGWDFDSPYSAGAIETQYGVTVTGDGTSSITLTGTARESTSCSEPWALLTHTISRRSTIRRRSSRRRTSAILFPSPSPE